MPSAIPTKRKKTNMNEFVNAIGTNVSDVPPNHEYVEVRSSQNNATSGKNERCVFEIVNNEFVITIGSVTALAPYRRRYSYEGGTVFKEVIQRNGGRKENLIDSEEKFGQPISDIQSLFDLMYARYINKRQKNGGCVSIFTTKSEKLETDVREGDYLPDSDPNHAILEELLNISRQFISENYTVSVDNIDEELMNKAKDLVNSLADEDITLAEVNRRLMILYTLIPRAIKNLRKEQVSTKEQIPAKIKKETELLSNLEAAIALCKNNDGNGAEQTFCEAFDIDIRPVVRDGEEWQEIIDNLGANNAVLSRAWRVSNHKLDSNMDRYIAEKGYDPDNCTMLFFHGSGQENMASLIANGPIEPKKVNAQICAWALGPGFYMGTCAAKSQGYTRAYGQKQYLLMCEAVNKEIYNINTERKGTPDSAADLERMHPGADLLASYCGDISECRYRYDEYVIFGDNSINADKSRVRWKYLLEFV